MQIVIDISDATYVATCTENMLPPDVKNVVEAIKNGVPLPKCKDCKWWKDSDGVYRRGVGAESKCPINNVSVNHGLGYCYMYEPHENEIETDQV